MCTRRLQELDLLNGGERLVLVCQRADDDPHGVGVTGGGVDPYFAAGELDNPHPQIRSALDYQKGVRFSWLTLGVIPVSLVMAAWLMLMYPWRPALGHLSVMLLLGILLVELCLYTFPKIPFTCSYLPGKAQIHIYFWVGLLICIKLLSQAAAFESRQLYRLAHCLIMLLAFATAALVMRYLSQTRASSSEELRFEEEYSATVTTLGL